MNIQKTNQGFAFLEILLVLVVVGVLAGVGFFVMNKKDSVETTTADTTTDTKKEEATTEKSEAKIKHLGVNLDYYNPATNKAGDFVFTKEKIEFSRLFSEYGFTVPANSVGPEKKNPQPTFILPLGSKVYSLVDGEVYDVPKLYSNDYSIQVQGEGSDLMFETEHVINVLVKKGDKVKAGDVIAEVSDYSVNGYAGMGLVEIGVLVGGNPPSHICPFDYLDESIKDETLKKITAFQKSWEEYLGDDTLYDEDVYMTGCIISDPIEG
jgi:prepilin-type N-terminal cleavage/methylation domain-containing protein